MSGETVRCAIVELSENNILAVGWYDVLVKAVEDAEPWRWFNPCLTVLENQEDLGLDDEFTAEIEKRVVAVPKSEWGYGNSYRGYVKENRIRYKIDE